MFGFSSLMIVVDLKLVPFDLPRIRRQVRQSVAGLPPSVGSAMFGFELGLGVRTFTSSLTLYLLPGLALFVLPTVTAWVLPALGATFGLVRGMVPLDRLLWRSSQRWDAALDSWSGLPRFFLAPTGLVIGGALGLLGT